MEMRVETTHTQTIKPSSPTPLSHRSFKLSLLDQFSPAVYTPLIFWYPADAAAVAVAGHDDHFAEAEERSHRLKKSLSETLTRFYPFAGRISGGLVECNDERVDFIEARVNCPLQDILQRPKGHLLRRLLPIDMESTEAATGRLLLVKVNFFECGGMAIGLCLSHKIADLCTINIFIKSWTAMTRGSSEVILSEFKTASSLFPPIDLPLKTVGMKYKERKVATRRLVFDASKISMLKAEAASADVPKPTRVEAVTALIWKCAMAAKTATRDGFTKPSSLLQAVNLRKTMPGLPENYIGNLISLFIAQTPFQHQLGAELQAMVKQLREGLRNFTEDFAMKLKGSGGATSAFLETAKEVGALSIRDDVDMFCCSSWSRFGLYENDFGWGQPRWVSDGGYTPPNYYELMDSRDGEGIEAWLTLTEAEMTLFERNEELLAFASVDSSVK